jgi:septal ring factor EnvC (AmiA/AmiB activator)
MFTKEGIRLTIKQAANLYGITPQAIYQRLKKEGVNIERMKSKETGELTPDAELVFSKLFSRHEGQKAESFKSIMEAQKVEIESLQKERQELLAQLKRLENENAELKNDKANWSKALEVAQALHRDTLNRLLPAAGQTVQTARKPIRERIGDFFKK